MVNPDMRFNVSPPRSSSPDGLGKPSGDDSRTKNFEKVLKRDDRGSRNQEQDDDKVKEKKGEEGETEEAQTGDAAGKPKEKPASIFDMSARQTTPPQAKFNPGATVEQPPSEELLVEMAENKKLSGNEKTRPEEQVQQPKVAVPKGSPQPVTVDNKNTDAENAAAAASREQEVSARDAKKQEQPKVASDKNKNASRDDQEFNLEAERSSKSKEKLPSDFTRNPSDMNQLTQAQQQQPLVNPMGEAKAAEAPRNPAQMKELVDQIVKEMYVVKTGDVTDTVMTIRHPPMFEGAQVKVTSFESARGEFNIAFENLSQQAKDILDSRLNRESLLLALNKEGYNVHIMTTSTQAASPLYTAQAEQRDQEKQQQQGQGQGQQEQQKDQQKKKG